MANMIKIFDTTLRDGEQAPGFSMVLAEKCEMAKQLERLGVDVIEAGFAIASPGDFESVENISKIIKNSTVCALARMRDKDIEAAAKALKPAVRPRIHVFIATSDLHMKYKLQMTREEVLSSVQKNVAYAASLVPEVEFTAEDATRSDPQFLYQVLETAIKAGASIVNIADTVGYTAPNEFYELVKGAFSHVDGIEHVTVSAHCHNDLGLAVANALAAVSAGASQVECTINGIGERAGNTSLEEFVMNLKARSDFYGVDCAVNTQQIYKTSALLSSITGVKVQPNKAIVGANAFAHEAGIHQHGMIANRETYQIIAPETIGLTSNRMVLGKHSGKHAVEQRLQEMGYSLSEENMEQAFRQFKLLADTKKEITDRDLEAMVIRRTISIPETYRLENYSISMGNQISSTAWVRMVDQNGTAQEAAVASHNGPIDAAFKAISQMVDVPFELADFIISAVTGGTNAQGVVYAKIKYEGKLYTGSGVSADTIEAGIQAYISAINTMIWATQQTL